ncbi:unnamed protein product, partial [Mesorhabditis belari]|uniref:Mitochondrial Rho GTPase 1 n=1 Tax=Mesorhabditis belari TaxID=2138241 RepID=A0AAF3J9W8_9BILA
MDVGEAAASATSTLKADVRMVLVGEEKVGKTSLLMALLEDEFVDHVPSKLDPVLIPADVTPENVVTSIVDTCSVSEDETSISNELSAANVICLIYDVKVESTVSKVTTYWLPLIRKVLGEEHATPIILVGNKSDGPNNHTQQVLPIMEQWGEVETCVECSARTMKNVSEIFYYAQKAVVYPTRPLYDVDEKRLTERARKALIRVFKICDRDNDGLLNDLELNAFQRLCFGIPLTPSAIEDVKRAVADGCPDGVVDDSLALAGFLYLHLLFIERGRHETTWTVPMGCSTELSPEGVQFVSGLFEKYDENKDGCLDPAELTSLFSACPANAFSREILAAVETNVRGWLTYSGYMAYWHMTTLTNLSQSLEQLAYLGFAVGRGGTGKSIGSTRDAIRITRERRVDLMERSTDRKVFQCLVVGAKDAGKTVFMQSMVGRGLTEVAAIGRRHSPYVINRVKVKDQDKYLLLREVDVLAPSDVLSGTESNGDVVAFLYDISNPDSFAFCATLYLKYFYRTKTPCVMVATKVEREEVEQRYETQPEEFCRQHELPRPIRFARSQIGQPSGSVFEQLATMACYPHLRRVYFLHDSNLLSRITFGAALAALAGFLKQMSNKELEEEDSSKNEDFDDVSESVSEQLEPETKRSRNLQKETETIPEGMSKRQFKKLQKSDRWQEKRKVKRAEEKAKRKERRAQLKADGKGQELAGRRFHRKMKDSQCKLRVAVDMQFDHLMTARDQKRTVIQLSWCYSVNRRAENPLQYHIVSQNGKSRQYFDKTYENWDAHRHLEPLEKVFDPEEIVYLTADSENVIEKLDDTKVYVIGGIIDHNSQKFLCYNLAKDHGFAHARLPIGEHIKMDSRKVLTINHVFEILLRVSEGNTWPDALMKVLPQRKSAAKKETDDSTSLPEPDDDKIKEELDE